MIDTNIVSFNGKDFKTKTLTVADIEVTVAEGDLLHEIEPFILAEEDSEMKKEAAEIYDKVMFYYANNLIDDDKYIVDTLEMFVIKGE